MKRIVKPAVVLCICIVMLVMTACTKKSGNGGDSSDVDVKSLVSAMVEESKDFPKNESLYKGDNDDEKWFEYLCEFDYNKVEDFGIKYSMETTADEIFVIKLKSSGDVEDMKKALTGRVESRKTQFATYAADEVDKIEHHKIIAEKDVVALIISSDTSGPVKVFQDKVK